ncbi:rhomboid family intramembrane serine protease GlpG [Alteromonas antoniana]|uniref:rhomboid family intramembrane serine protease GlpG n=1 Tax=Alteromonas antoniana TaxID=2803813 RepID=UPI001C4661FD
MNSPLIAFRQEGVAHLLANYLKSQSIDAKVERTSAGDEYMVVLANEDDALRARDITEAFLRNPNDPKYQQAAWEHGQQVTLTRTGSGMSIAGMMKNAMTSPMTASVLVICVVVYALSLFGLFAPIASELMMQPLSLLVQNHEWWRVIGPAFIHFSILHIVFNLLWWGMLGAQIERTLGVSMLMLVFVISAVTSNIGQSFFTDPLPGGLLPFGGLSGVVYALMGFVWWLGWLKPQWGLSIPRGIIGFMLVWLVLGYADILWVNMANAAHTVGLITGCLLAAVLSIGADKRAD